MVSDGTLWSSHVAIVLLAYALRGADYVSSQVIQQLHSKPTSYLTMSGSLT